MNKENWYQNINIKIIITYLTGIILFSIMLIITTLFVDFESVPELVATTTSSLLNLAFYSVLTIALCYITRVYLFSNQWVYVKRNPKFVIWLSLLGFYLMLTVIFLMTSIHSLMNRSDIPDNEQAFREMASSGWYNLLMVFITAVILAPIVEELVFRKALYGLFEKRLGVIAAILINSLIFALIHDYSNLIFIIQYFSMGIVLSFIYYYSGKLIFVPIFAHMLNNLLVIVIIQLI